MEEIIEMEAPALSEERVEEESPRRPLPRKDRNIETFDVNDLAAIKVGLASPEAIRSWSHGEVTRGETVNYRSQKPEMGGLFCEKIFGPAKDYECHCGKYKKIRYQGITCEKCGVEVISKEWRRERMGHIELVSPCSHIWYLKSIPSRMYLVLDIPPKELEEIIYFAAHVVLNPGNRQVLKKKQYISESVGREVFPEAIQDVLDNGIVSPNSADFEFGKQLIANLTAKNEAGIYTEAYDFFAVSRFLNKYTGAEFGEGAAAIKRLLQEIDLDKEFDDVQKALAKNPKDPEKSKLTKRLEVISAFRDSKQKPEWMILDVIPVIPPDLRPMLQLDGGRFTSSDLNELYRRVIARNTRLKKLIDIKAPYVILMNEKRMLQEAVDALIDNGRRTKAITGSNGRPFKSLSAALKGKPGRFRQNLLGKRVDYSGRSVIAVGPDLKMYQCGIPREMAIQLLRPFIAAILIKTKRVTAHRAADKIIDRYDPVVFDIVESIISDHPVLLNRAPTLHRLSIQAFQPKLVDGRAIRLHPLVCPGFNADFDGDQMAVHVPLSKAAQKEAVDLMLASNNILGPKDGKAIVIPGQDMILGNWHLTTEETAEDFLARAEALRAVAALPRSGEAALETPEILRMVEKDEEFAKNEGKVFASVDEVRNAYANNCVSLHSRIVIPASKVHKDEGTGLPIGSHSKYLITTVGKLIFNDVFPDDFPYINDKVTDSDSTASLLAKLKADLVSPAELEAKGFGKGEKSPLVEYIATRPLKGAVGKNSLGPLIDLIFKDYGTSKTSAVLDKIKDQGFKFSMISAVTVSISDINDVEGKYDLVKEGQAKVDKIEEVYLHGYLTAEERHKQIVAVWKDITERVKELVHIQMQKNKRNPLVIMADSKSRGSLDNFKQLIGMKGLVANPKNEEIELPIISSYLEGMKVSEFFINTHGARKGSADTALKTADSGYLTRRLVDVSQDVIVREDDCHTDHGFKVREIRDTAQDAVIRTLQERIVGRYAMHDVIDPSTGIVLAPGNELITREVADSIVKAGIKEVEIRSVLTCQTKDGVCRYCYGLNMATGRLVEKGEAVGIMAAQSIGEPGTQLTMRVFHTGGMAGTDITQGLPRVQELVEARNPKGEAIISKTDGYVTKVVQEGDHYIVTISSYKDGNPYNPDPENKIEDIQYTTTYGSKLRVKAKVDPKNYEHVENGGKITEGAVNPRSLLALGDVEKLEVYMIKEIQKVYHAQGIGISDKHLEIIVRQMLRKVQIVDGGETSLLPGTRVSTNKFAEENTKALLEGKRPAICTPLILGITKAALETDSFLSAASFQETTRILTDAAIKAKRDDLHGLKENVITGKLIPAGTGLRKDDEDLSDFTVEGEMKRIKDAYIEKHDRPDAA